MAEATPGQPAHSDLQAVIAGCRASHDRLLRTLDGIDDATARRWPCRELPFHRWREVEIHHVDLGLGYGYGDWPEEYLARELPRTLATVPGRLTDPAERRRLLAWLVGRAVEPGSLQIEDWDARSEQYFTGEQEA